MERELVEDALEALKPRYQRTRTPFSLTMIREDVEDQHGASLAVRQYAAARLAGNMIARSLKDRRIRRFTKPHRQQRLLPLQ